MTGAGDPELPVVVGVPERSGRWLDAAPEGADGLAAAVGSGLDELLGILGIPGRAQVAQVPARHRPSHEWLWLEVGGRVCRYSEELLARVAAEIDGRHVAAPPLELASSWPERDAGGPPSWQRVTELLTRLAVEAVKLQPSVLLGRAQAEAYGRRLREARPEMPAAVLEPEFLSRVLAGVVGLGISIADTGRVAELLGALEGVDETDARELLIAALSTDVVELLVPERFLEQLGSGDLGDEDDLLAFLAQGMFEDTGIVFPVLRCVPPTDLPDGFFAFRLNHVLTTPLRSLEADEILVNEASHILDLFTRAEPTMNPVTGQPAAIAPLDSKELIELRGHTTWTPAGHIILCLADVLRTRSSWFVHQDKVQAQLDTLESMLPRAVRAARADLPPPRLASLVRALAAGRVPLYHQPVLLERIIERPYAELGLDRLNVLDDPVTALPAEPFPDDEAALEAFVRTGLRREIADRCCGRTRTLLAYLVDPPIERLLRSPRGPDDDDAVVAAFREELLQLPLAAQTPAVLAADDVRRTLQDLLALALPRVAVVGYGDLPADLNIQPIARVRLPDREVLDEPADVGHG